MIFPRHSHCHHPGTHTNLKLESECKLPSHLLDVLKQQAVCASARENVYSMCVKWWGCIGERRGSGGYLYRSVQTPSWPTAALGQISSQAVPTLGQRSSTALSLSLSLLGRGWETPAPRVLTSLTKAPVAALTVVAVTVATAAAAVQ